MQAEFVTCYNATGQAVWLKNFIPALRVMDSISRPITMHRDNQSAVFFYANDKLSGASKHIDVKYRIVKDRNRGRTIKIEHISTTANIADPLTKSLSPSLFQKHVLGMDLVDTFDQVMVQGH
jgi:hypothetical protein